MTLEFFSATDTGRARNNNEDSVALDEPTALVVLAVVGMLSSRDVRRLAHRTPTAAMEDLPA